MVAGREDVVYAQHSSPEDMLAGPSVAHIVIAW